MPTLHQIPEFTILLYFLRKTCSYTYILLNISIRIIRAVSDVPISYIFKLAHLIKRYFIIYTFRGQYIDGFHQIFIYK